jgi:hypothetical protein
MLFAFGCASLPPARDQAIQGLQTSEVALSAAYTAERALCFVQPQVESGPHCTNPSATVVGLTDKRHQDAGDYAIAAFQAQKKAALALQLWQPGQVVPTDVATYQSSIQNLLSVAQTLAPGANEFLSKAQSAVLELTKVLVILGVK